MGTDHERDPGYLRDVQYADSIELAKRANLHVKYGTAGRLMFDWLPGLIDWPAGGRVLDVGCGGGYLWEHAAAVVPDGVDLVLSDLSPGMVDEAVGLARATGRFRSVEGRPCDARDLPFADGSFDVVTSTYALYHVPEPDQAVAEIARVVGGGGTVAIATNGPGHMGAIEDARVAAFGASARYSVNHSFSPPVAASMLVGAFDRVDWHRFDDTLLVTDLGDAFAAAASSPPATDASRAELDALRSALEDAMVDGVLRVEKHTGAFVCRSPRRP